MNVDSLELSILGAGLACEEPFASELLFYTAAQEDGAWVVIITGRPELTEPTWGVLFE